MKQRLWVLALTLSMGSMGAIEPGMAFASQKAPSAAPARPAGPPFAATVRDADALSRECEYGITMGLAGSYAKAESAFISLLGHAPHDPRALTNLGNVALLRGDPELAQSFYLRAAERDSTDPGITLDLATAYLLVDDEDQALKHARNAIERAGGARAAARLLGLPESGLGALPKAADRAYIGRDEVLQLLRAAAGEVPSDSTKVAPPKPPAQRGSRRAVVWRSAGGRGSEGTQADAVLYWKR